MVEIILLIIDGSDLKYRWRLLKKWYIVCIYKFIEGICMMMNVRFKFIVFKWGK